jgi:hypothetical protein
MLTNAADLGLYLKQLRGHFLPDDRLKELEEPEHFAKDLDARAYLILAHSAFEQFFEDTAAEISELVLDHWNNTDVFTKQTVVSIATLGTTNADYARAVDASIRGVEQGGIEPNPRRLLGDAIRSAVPRYKKDVIDENHGTDIRYLRSLFLPIGVVVDLSPNARSALTHISNARGTFAHRRTTLGAGKFAYQPLAAQKALTSADDLFEWCVEFEMNLRRNFDFSYVRLHDLARFELFTRLCAVLRTIAQSRS